jgi:hypothetical protein
MLIQETFVNVTREAQIGESGLYEPFTDDLGKLYRVLVKEHGRCTGRVYIDTKEGTKAIGWVFIKRRKYDDSNETYLAETWVTLHERQPDTTVIHHYLNLK